jgi:hypothetical protein
VSPKAGKSQGKAGKSPGKAGKSAANTAKSQAKTTKSQAKTAMPQGTVAGTPTGVALAGKRSAAMGTGAVAGTVNTAPSLLGTQTGTTSGSIATPSYTYGVGTGARHYRAYGYGRGYLNRNYGAGYGYGRSQGYNRGIIARLRSVHAGLARLDHDYQGHRVRAMHAISMAVRQLSHGSMASRQVGFARGTNGAMAMGMGMGMGMRRGLGGAAARRQPMGQAQSDLRMSQALRTLQGINMQLAGQGFASMGRAGASMHVNQAIQEIRVALSIR